LSELNFGKQGMWRMKKGIRVQKELVHVSKAADEIITDKRDRVWYS